MNEPRGGTSSTSLRMCNASMYTDNVTCDPRKEVMSSGVVPGQFPTEFCQDNRVDPIQALFGDNATPGPP